MTPTEVARHGVKGTPVGPSPRRYRWLAPHPAPWELVAAASAAVVSMLVIGYLAQDTWFLADSWALIVGRDLSEPMSLIRPHSGHLVVPAAALHQVLFSWTSIDYWPWYFLPRLVGYGAMTYFTWYLIRRRGADPVVAWVVLGILLFFGPSWFLTAATVGPFLVIPAVGLAAVMLDGGAPRTLADKTVLAGLLGVMVASASQGVLGVASVGLVAGVSGRTRAVLPSFIAAGAPYLLWYTFVKPPGPELDLSIGDLAHVPGLSWDLASGAAAAALALPPVLGSAALVLLLGILTWWTVRSRLTAFDWVWLATTGAYIASVILVRIIPGDADTDADHYHHYIALLLVFVFAPRIRLPATTPARVAILGGCALIAVGNLSALASGLAAVERESSAIRERVEAVGSLIAAGEPSLGFIDLDERGRVLRTDDVRGFLDRGWEPPPRDSDAVEEARGVMRLKSTAQVASFGVCEVVGRGQSISIETGGDPRFTLEAATPTTTEMAWVDRHGTGRRTLRPDGRVTVRYVDGIDALITATVIGDAPVTVCVPDAPRA